MPEGSKIKMMKTTGNIFLAIAVLLCFSCTKTDRVYSVEQQEIALKPIAGPTLKAEGDPVPYPDAGVFGLYACYSASSGEVAWDALDAWPASSLYIDNAAFGMNGEVWAGYDPETSGHKPYYWPLDGSLMFVGYSPHISQNGETGVTSVSLNKNSDDILHGVNPYLQIGFTQSAAVAEMVDLLWFDAKDVNLGKTLSKTADAVPVLFKHALSKVSLKFKDSENYYQIKSLSMKGCVNSGTFYSGKTAGWLPVITALADYAPVIESTIEDGKTKYPTLNNWTSPDMLIIPQYLDGVFPTLGTGTQDSGVDVVLEFVVTDGFGEQKIEILMKEYTDRWEQGKHYQYNVTVNADPIDFGAPSVTITTQTISM